MKRKAHIIKALIILVSITIIASCTFFNNSTKNAEAFLVKNETLGNPPGTYSILNNKDEIKIPFGFYGINLLVHGTMNGKKVKLLIDNGHLWDDIWFYNGEVDSLNLYYKSDEELMLIGAGEDEGSTIKVGRNVDISFGKLQFYKQPTLISVPEAGYDRLFPGINGQVSSLFFKHFIVTFNFDENIMVLTKPEKFSYSGNGHIIPMIGGKDGSYSIPIKIQGLNKELFIDIDLGGVFPLSLFENEDHQITIPDESEKVLVGYGASGAIYGYKESLNQLEIGGYTLNNIPSVFIKSGSNIAAEEATKAGIIGLPLFKHFNVSFDYFNNQIYFEPNKSFNDPFVEDEQ